MSDSYELEKKIKRAHAGKVAYTTRHDTINRTMILSPYKTFGQETGCMAKCQTHASERTNGQPDTPVCPLDGVLHLFYTGNTGRMRL